MTTTPRRRAGHAPTLAEVAEIIVTALNLEMSPDEIEADARFSAKVSASTPSTSSKSRW
jgi:hypothetical protein